MADSNPQDLHARADRLWRELDPGDLNAARFSDAVALVLDGRVALQRRAENWILTLHRYEGHWQRTGRAPRENTRARDTLPDGERNLGEWARYQRRFDDGLNAYQRARLDVSPAFDWDPLEAAWRDKLAGCAAFIAQNGTLPRLHAADPAEFMLARWLGRQLHRMQTGRLAPHRTSELHRLLRHARQ